jgi:hypothetical protein
MPISLYMDHNVPRSVTVGLRLRGIDVLAAFDDGYGMSDDATLMDRAAGLKRVLFSFDDDVIVEAVERQRNGKSFGGVIYAHPLKISIGRCISDLEIIAKAGSFDEILNGVIYLPL